MKLYHTTLSKPNTVPLLILHGLLGSKQNFQSIGKHLFQRLNRTVISLDLRNHGESFHSQIHSYDQMALDIAEFMSQNQYKNASLLGHSMGAKVAMTLALRQPILIEKLILVDMAPTVNPISSEIVEFFKYFREIERLNLDIKQANEYLSQYVKNDSIRMFLMTNYKRIGDRYGFRVNLTALEQSLPHLGSFEAGNEGNVFQKDSLFIRGSKSNYVPESSIPTIKQLFPKSKVVTLDAGHWVHFEQPKEFINQCVDFLQ